MSEDEYTEGTLLAEPKPPGEDGDAQTVTMRERVKAAVDARDGEELAALLDPLPISAALRQLLALSADDRDTLLELVPTELAAALIEEAPHAVATDLVERLETKRAAKIIEELDSDLQADLIGDLDEDDAEAILAEMEPEDAADVRRLVEYEDETAGGLMVAEAFQFQRDRTPSAKVLRGLSRTTRISSATAGSIPTSSMQTAVRSA